MVPTLKNFYVRLQVPRTEMNELACTVRRTFWKLVDLGFGTVQSRSECWIELAHHCDNTGQVLATLRMLGISADVVKECREIAPNTGHLMAKQPSLF